MKDHHSQSFDAKPRLISRLAFGLAAVACAAAWLLPGEKDGAVAGRLDYPQFLAAVVLSAVCLSIAPFCLLRSRRPRRSLLLRLLAVWLGLAVAVGGWEIVALLWPPRHAMENPWYTLTDDGMTADNDLPFVRPPHLHWTGVGRGDLALLADAPDPDARMVTFQTDSQGFRNADEKDRADIAFIGDSFTEAGNVLEDETFVSLVGRRSGMTVRNLGLAGQSPPSELVILKKYALPFQPRTVVWQIAEANDLPEAVDFKAWEAAGRPKYTPRQQKSLSHIVAWQRRSLSWQLFVALRRPAPWSLSGVFSDADGHSHRILFLPELPALPQNPRRHEGWPIVADAITEGAAILRQQHIELIVTLIPMKLRVMADATRLDELTLNVEGQPLRVKDRLPPRWDLPPNSTWAFYLTRLCRQLDITFIDATPELQRQTAAGQLVYLPTDTHLSPRGHEVVSDLIVAALAEKSPDNGQPDEP